MRHRKLAYPTSFESVILVEGKDDAIVVKRIVEGNAEKSVETRGFEGKDRLLDNIEGFLLGSAAKSVGIIADANADLEDRWKAIRNRLTNCKLGVEIPDRLPQDGLILNCKPRVGVWLMPDNENSGALESFLEQMIPEGAQWNLAVEYVNDAVGKGIESVRGKNDVWLMKAKIYAWLAIEDPGMKTGTAIDSGKLKLDGELCQRFISWIKVLCE